MTFLAGELLRAGLVAGLYLLIFAGAEAWRAWASPPPEWTRKAVHMAGGIVALFLPWILRSHWSVLLLGLGFAGVLLLTRRLGWLRSVHGVERRSEGGIYFPIAIYLVYLLAADRPEFYLISILALVLSDALAALVGTAYGRTVYRVEADRRSVEGSVVFFLVTFLGVHIPLLLLTGIDPAASVLIGVQIALLVTLLEAVSIRGGDNLIVPLATYFLLVKMTPLPADQVALHIVAQLLIVGLIALLMWRSRMLTASGIVAASLFFYGAWSLGGPAWLAAPVLGLLVFRWIAARFGEAVPAGDARYQVLAVYHTTLVAILAFVLDDLLQMLPGDPVTLPVHDFYPVYLGALAAHLAMLGTVFMHGSPWAEGASARHRALALLLGIGVIVPVGIWAGPAGWSAPDLLTPISMAVIAVIAYPLVWRLDRLPREKPWDLRMQSACTALAAVLVLPLLLGGGG